MKYTLKNDRGCTAFCVIVKPVFFVEKSLIRYLVMLLSSFSLRAAIKCYTTINYVLFNVLKQFLSTRATVLSAENTLTDNFYLIGTITSN